MSEIKNQVPRRKFLKGAAAGSVGAAALGFDAVSAGANQCSHCARLRLAKQPAGAKRVARNRGRTG